MRDAVHPTGMARKLTTMQQRFVDAYDGNATAAARKAGYSGTDKSLTVTGARLLANGRVAPAIAAREQKRAAGDIATREERQRFWSDVLRGKYADGEGGGSDFKDRLKASELLARSEADFIDSVRHQGADGGELQAPGFALLGVRVLDARA